MHFALGGRINTGCSRGGVASIFWACTAPSAATVVWRRRGGVRGASSFASSLKEGLRLLGALKPALPGAEGASSPCAPTHPGLGGVPSGARLLLLDALDPTLDAVCDAPGTEKKDVNEDFLFDAMVEIKAEVMLPPRPETATVDSL